MDEFEKFFIDSSKPSSYDEIATSIECFCRDHGRKDHRLILVTSGGTVVPLERNAVRFVDNFSSGIRGAASTEYFLNYDYAVIFLFRLGSAEPFLRHFKPKDILDMVSLQSNGNLILQGHNIDKVRSLLLQYNDCHKSGNLLKVPYSSVYEYMWFLKSITHLLSKYSSRAAVYSAAAVSDFYQPEDQLPEHKIQSSTDSLRLNLQPVPKMMKPLVSTWGPNIFVVTFKLETLEEILINKAKQSLINYNHQLVIGNLLQTRRENVVLITLTDTVSLTVSSTDLLTGKELEELIVAEVVKRHSQFLLSGKSLQ